MILFIPADWEGGLRPTLAGLLTADLASLTGQILPSFNNQLHHCFQETTNKNKQNTWGGEYSFKIAGP